MSTTITQLELNYQDTAMNGIEYILCAESTFTEPNIIANGHDPIPGQLENGVLKIGLLVTESSDTSGGSGPSNTTHYVNLGDLCYETDDFDIEVTVYDNSRNPRTTNRVRNTSAKEVHKPIS